MQITKVQKMRIVICSWQLNWLNLKDQGAKLGIIKSYQNVIFRQFISFGALNLQKLNITHKNSWVLF